MAVFLNDARNALSNQLGEDTMPNPWPAIRDQHIQWSLERIARIYDFDFGMEVLSVTTDSTGKYVIQVADGVRSDPRLDIRIPNAGTGNDFVFEICSLEDFDNFAKGDYRYYLSTDNTGAQTIITTEPSTTIQVTATRVAPVLSASVPTNFPSALGIAKGALIYYREYEDKDADVSVEDAKFQQIVQEVTGAEQRNNEPKRARTLQEETGHYTGEVRRDVYGTWSV